MRIDLHKGLFMDAAGAPAGGGAAAVADPPAGSGAPPAAPAAGSGSPAVPAAGAKFDWKGLSLEPDVQAVVDTHQWENPNAAIRSYANLHKLTSLPPERLLKLPTDKSTPEEWKEFHTKIGVPAKAEDYKLPVPEGDKGEFATEAAKWMHEAGVPVNAAQKLATKWNEKMVSEQKAQAAAIKQRHESEIADLKTEWGVDYEKHEQMVDRAASQFGMTKEQLDGLKTAMGPKGAMKFLKEIGMKVGTEGEFIDTERGNGGFNENMTTEQAKAQLEALKKDKAFQEMYVSKDPKTRQEARQKMDRLSRLAAPGVTEYPGAPR